MTDEAPMPKCFVYEPHLQIENALGGSLDIDKYI